MLAAHHFVFHRGVGDSGAEIIFRADLGGDFFAEHHGFGGRFDRYLVLGFFVFFNAEGAAAAVYDINEVLAERGIAG